MIRPFLRIATVVLFWLLTFPSYAQLGQIIPAPMLFSFYGERDSTSISINPQTIIVLVGEELTESLYYGSSDTRAASIATSMDQLRRIAEVLNVGIEGILGYQLPILAASTSEELLSLERKLADGYQYITLGSGFMGEGESGSYMLMTASEKDSKGFFLLGQDAAGVFYGVQSFLQMLNPQGNIPSVAILDWPRFAYRGVHLDVSRHFFDKQYIKHLLDLMARYKLNTFHWHLVDGGGWRFPSENYPLLTKHAAFRTQQDWNAWWSGGDRRFVPEGTPEAYGGYYSKEDIREIVQYAADRYITIVPEIELPGHSNEVFAAYPNLQCPTSKGSSEFCIGNDSTFTFLTEVLDEVLELFPSQLIHIGGDEANTEPWQSCPRCKARMQAEGLSQVRDLQTYSIHRIARYLGERGRRMIGWDEVMDGPLPDSAVVMSWRGSAAGVEAARQGHFVIMTPGDDLYLNHYQADPTTEPQAQGGYTPLERVYQYRPAPDTLPDSVSRYIMGSQACLWTEYIATPEHADYMYLPRLLAHAEACWRAGGLYTQDGDDHEVNDVDYKDFLLRANGEVAWLRSKGINAYPLHGTSLSARLNEAKNYIEVLAETEKMPIDALRYTRDGSNPTCRSASYDPTAGIVVRDSALIAIAPFVADSIVGPVVRCRADYHKAIGAKVKYDCKVYPDYRAGGEQALVDGYRGGSTYLDGRWQGFIRPMDLTIDLGKKKRIKSVSATFMQVKSAAVEMPEDVEVLVSADGRTYHSLGVQHRRTSPDDPQFRLEDFVFRTAKPMAARYVRFVAKQKAGPLYFLFTDEIVVW